MASNVWKTFNQVFNPFETVRYNSNIFPDTRSEFTSFGKKLGDTYQVIKGGTEFKEKRYVVNSGGILVIQMKRNRFTGRDEPGKYRQPFRWDTRPGIFDYATLGVFRLIHFLLDQTKNARAELADEAKKSTGFTYIGLTLIRLFLILPHFLLFLSHSIGNGLVRPLVAAATTLALSPVIFLAHYISKVVGKFREINVAQLDVDKPTGFIDPNDPNKGLSFQTVKLYQVLGNHSLRDANIVHQNPNTSEEYIAIYQTKKSTQPVAYAKLSNLGVGGVHKLMSVNESMRVAIEGSEATKPRYRR